MGDAESIAASPEPGQASLPVDLIQRDVAGRFKTPVLKTVVMQEAWPSGLRHWS